MSYLLSNEQKLNDIIFENRNKAYGAYDMRSAYGQTIFRSVSIVLLSFGSLAGTAFYMTNHNGQGPENGGQVVYHDSIYVVPFGPEEEEKQEETKKPEKPAPKPPAQPEDNSSVVIKDTVETSKQALNEQIAAVNNSTAPATGDATGPESDEKKGDFEKKGRGGMPDTAIKKPFEVDSMPEFEGGLKALYRFVSERLKYPEDAYGMGKGGTVFVKFVVDEKGYVTNLSLLNNLGFGMDEEALRVVRQIPKFKAPAKAKGKAVRSYYQLPIKFTTR